MCSRPENPQEHSNSSDSLRFRDAYPSDQGVVRQTLQEGNLSFHASNESDRCASGQVGYTRASVCERGGEIVGVLQWRNLGEEAEILDLAVRIAHRRQGIASFLLREFLPLTQKLAVRQVFLEVRESNAAAVSLYRSFGFTISGRRENYYHHPEEAALLLSLKIPG